MFGLLLIPFFFRSDKVIKIWTRVIFSILSVLLSIVVLLVMLVDKYVPEEDLSSSFSSASAEKLDAVMLNGTYLESIGTRTAVWLETLPVLVQGSFAFVAFLVGMRAARSRFLSQSTSNRSISKLLKIGFIIGLPVQLLIASGWLLNERSLERSEAIYFALFLLSVMTAPLLSMGYLWAILAIIRKRPNLLALMQPAGMVSLTTYISQSLAMLLIFAPWGLGQFQKVELWQLLPIALMIWLIQVYCATLLLKRFNLGPLESALNFLTKNR